MENRVFTQPRYLPRMLDNKKENRNFFFWRGGLLGLEFGLHLELLHQPFFVIGFFRHRVLRTICLGWP
jgi:hypothetical protein